MVLGWKLGSGYGRWNGIWTRVYCNYILKCPFTNKIEVWMLHSMVQPIMNGFLKHPFRKTEAHPRLGCHPEAPTPEGTSKP